MMVKWFRTYCFLKQFCGTEKCPDIEEKCKIKSCAICSNFYFDSDYEYHCKIHEFPLETECYPCGSFCKDFKEIGDS